MNLAYFIAKRIHYDKSEGGENVSRPAIRIAISGIAVGLAVMIIAVAVVIGFKNQIRDKVIGFGSHIQISNFDSNVTYETKPIAFSDSLIAAINEKPGVMSTARMATKPAVIKTDSAFQAVVMKGVGAEYDWRFFAKNMVEGDTLSLSDSLRSNDILISTTIANQLELELGDSFVAYFIQDGARARKFSIKGIYQTDFVDYDQIFIVGDISHVQRLNDWKPDQVSGLEIMVDDYGQLDNVSDDIFYTLQGKADAYGDQYYVRSITELNPQIFSWLELLDLNVWVILILMSLVAAFTMISGLLIIILERTSMIGILKAMGYSNWEIRKVFLYVSAFITLKGLFWGNIIGLGFCLLQMYFKPLALDPSMYYLDSVPIELNLLYVVLLNLSAGLISLLVLIGPSYVISKISPAKSIKFE